MTGLRERLALLLVTDRKIARRPLAESVAAALRGGVTAVMLREKDLATADLIAIGRGVADACRAAGALFVVNGNLSAARALGADGVQLGYGAPGVAEARDALGRTTLVGLSTHDRTELDAARNAGADYVTFGPVWETPSKRGILDARGTDALAGAVANAGRMQVVALGGVTAARAADVRRTGAAGIACIAAILATGDELAAAAAIRSAWEAAA
ncbi:MAG: thiamine phosphate synthase [Planctomycetes bacterium]|nr:thiamine phosphate synthase [Planctomycetota bacterium]